MKSVSVLVLMAMSFAALAPTPSAAEPRGRGWHGDIRGFEHHDLGHWRGGAWRHGMRDGRLGWWWVVGGMWYFYPQPVYPYPDPYIPPVVVAPQATAPVMVAPQPAPVAPQAAQYWYYCEASRSYYPYVSSCEGGWKPVPATPSGGMK